MGRRHSHGSLMTLVLVGAAISAAACSPQPSPPAAQAAASVPSAPLGALVPKTSINAMMVALVDHAAHNLWDIERDGMAPKSSADWEVVAEHAIQIAAAGSAITAGGTGPTDSLWAQNPSWRTHAQEMADAGMAALRASQEKSLDRLREANGQLVEACEACHKEFKPAVPSEGIMHGHAHAGEADAVKK